jgi:hypothetical protein
MPEDKEQLIAATTNDDITYHSTKYSTKLEYSPRRSVLAVTKAGNGHFVVLSERDRRELAFDLLKGQFTVDFDGEDGEITLTPVKPKPVPIKVGQFYRVKSQVGMDPAFAGNPIVRVVKACGQAYFHVETADGAKSGWHAQRDGTIEGLEGPIEVEAKVTWLERPTEA